MDRLIAQYLQVCQVIDWQTPAIKSKAAALAVGAADQLEIARRCFEFVRDEIEHSNDYQRDETTLRASDVLALGTGWCYAKSHLLAALLRANAIPAGLCYQRLTIDGDSGPFCLHGLNAVLLEGYGWYRIDARGNRADVNAAFVPPVEQLAFPVRYPGEADISGIFSQPLPEVVQVLSECSNRLQVLKNLPDIALF